MPDPQSPPGLAPAIGTQASAGVRGTGWLVLLYPVLTRVAVHYRSASLTLLATLVLTLVLLGRGLLARHAGAWLGLLAALAVLAGLASLHVALLSMYLPPVLFNLFLAWFFGRTLVRGSRPLIERMAWHMHDREPLSPAHLAYTRGITWLWTVFFVAMATINALLGLFAHPDGVLELLGVESPLAVPLGVWFWFANLLNFGLAAVLMACEYAYRQWHFPEDRHRYGNVLAFVQRLRGELPAIWYDLMRRA
jgi:uncharacterized membrane protein